MSLDINTGLSGISHKARVDELPDFGASRKTTVSTTNTYELANNLGNALGFENRDKEMLEFARNKVRHQYDNVEHKKIFSSIKKLIGDYLKRDMPDDSKKQIQELLDIIETDADLFADALMARRILIAV